MAAFDRIRCGFPELDEILDYIRLGDNVVWQVTDIGEFSMFARPFVRQAVEDGRDVTYVRFAQHDPLIEDLTGVHLLELNPDIGFEAFTVALYEEITHRGREAIYVFDCLSELQSVWYTDLMMGNFFCVICPYLFELDTVAYFPLLRGRHSFDAIARIRDTTQLLLDVCTNEDDVYLRPLKVWNRNSERMFLPHGYSKKNGRFFTIGNGVRISQYYKFHLSYFYSVEISTLFGIILFSNFGHYYAVFLAFNDQIMTKFRDCFSCCVPLQQTADESFMQRISRNEMQEKIFPASGYFSGSPAPQTPQ